MERTLASLAHSERSKLGRTADRRVLAVVRSGAWDTVAVVMVRPRFLRWCRWFGCWCGIGRCRG